MVIDKDSIGTIATVVVPCVISVVLILIFVRRLWISVPISVLILCFAFFVIWFHRVPVRVTPEPQNDRLVTSVADGKVVILEKAFESEYLKKECIQVSVYMNFFDVHANFWPMNGTVSYYQYHPGKYLLAFKPKASEENEHSSTALKNEYGEIFFKQIAGTFARRIVCYSKEGAKETRGEQCGIIKFGSRIDIFLPLDAKIKVKIGDLTVAGETVIAEL